MKILLCLESLDHVAAIDGFSRKIVGFITVPVKSSKAIYKPLLRYKIVIILALTLTINN